MLIIINNYTNNSDNSINNNININTNEEKKVNINNYDNKSK